MPQMFSHVAQRSSGFKPICHFFTLPSWHIWSRELLCCENCPVPFGWMKFGFGQKHLLGFLVLINPPDKCVELRLDREDHPEELKQNQGEADHSRNYQSQRAGVTENVSVLFIGPIGHFWLGEGNGFLHHSQRKMLYLHSRLQTLWHQSRHSCALRHYWLSVTVSLFYMYNILCFYIKLCSIYFSWPDAQLRVKYVLHWFSCPLFGTLFYEK